MRDESAVQAAHAWAAAQIQYAFGSAGRHMHPDTRLVLTEDGYTTADGPMPKAEALAEFDRFAPNTSPHSGTRLRVMSEAEYQRSNPTGGDRA